MQFSVNYQSAYKLAADEIKCPFNKLGYIQALIKEHPEKRYVIIVESKLNDENIKTVESQIGLLKDIVSNNYTIQFNSILDLQYFLGKGYNAFLKFPITDWETFTLLKEANVTDIYIDGPLCFQMNKIIQGKGSIKIRMSPTISANASLGTTERDICSAFVRPEDLKYYDGVDIIDFQESDQDKEDTLFKIYTRGSYNFELHSLINHLRKQDNIENWAFGNNKFGEKRANCGQVCKIPGRSCHYCNTLIAIMQNAKRLSE